MLRQLEIEVDMATPPKGTDGGAGSIPVKAEMSFELERNHKDIFLLDGKLKS